MFTRSIIKLNKIFERKVQHFWKATLFSWNPWHHIIRWFFLCLLTNFLLVHWVIVTIVFMFIYDMHTIPWIFLRSYLTQFFLHFLLYFIRLFVNKCFKNLSIIISILCIRIFFHFLLSPLSLFLGHKTSNHKIFLKKHVGGNGTLKKIPI